MIAKIINFQIEKLPAYALISILKTNSANEEYNSWDKADNPWIHGDITVTKSRSTLRSIGLKKI